MRKHLWAGLVLLAWLGMGEPALADNCGSLSDCYGVAIAAAIAGVAIPILISLLLDFSPIGPLKGILEAIIGRDLFGNKLAWWERALGLIPGGRSASRAAHAVETAAEEAARAGRQVGNVAEEIGDVAREVEASRDIERAADSFDEYKRIVETLDVSTTRNSAVFYSGSGNRQLAEQFAIQNGKTTLEMTPGGRFLDEHGLFEANSPLTYEQATEIWSRLSERYAQEASGNVVGFVQGARPNGIFNSVESPTLMRNSDITNLITGGF